MIKIDKITIAILCIIAGLFLVGGISLIYSIVTKSVMLIIRDIIIAGGAVSLIVLSYIKRKLDE